MSALKGKTKEYLTVKDLQKVLDSCKLHLSQIDEVWPNLYIGNVAVAQNKAVLLRLGITHILNAAHAKQGSIGNQNFYGNDVVYCGIPADDSAHFDLDVYFRPAADFIHKALKSPDGTLVFNKVDPKSQNSHFYTKILEKRQDGDPTFVPPFTDLHSQAKGVTGKVLVHCIMGMSRSSTLVLAYLMIYHHMPLKKALQKVVQKRAIYPNRNFLALLLDLELQLTKNKKKKTCQIL